MDKAQVDEVLRAAEQTLSAGGNFDLGPLGFWKAVAATKKRPDLVEEFADRIGAIDREAFERWALLKIPSRVGTALAVVATAGGMVLIGWAYRLDGASQGVALLMGTGVVLVATHGLAHWVVARAQGMRVICWFVGTMRAPQPGIKVDYATYLRVPARQRAWMHASGAIVSKLVPLVAFGAGWAMHAPGWTMVILGVLGVGQIATDVIWSTKASDWKKFKREMAVARVG